MGAQGKLINFDNSKTKAEAISLSEEHPNTMYLTTDGYIVFNNKVYSGSEGSNEIFIAAYNVTKFNDIISAINDNKIVVCKYPNLKITGMLSKYDNTLVTFSAVYNTGTSYQMCYTYTCNSRNIWSTRSNTIQTINISDIISRNTNDTFVPTNIALKKILDNLYRKLACLGFTENYLDYGNDPNTSYLHVYGECYYYDTNKGKRIGNIIQIDDNESVLNPQDYFAGAYSIHTIICGNNVTAIEDHREYANLNYISGDFVERLDIKCIGLKEFYLPKLSYIVSETFCNTKLRKINLTNADVCIEWAAIGQNQFLTTFHHKEMYGVLYLYDGSFYDNFALNDIAIWSECYGGKYIFTEHAPTGKLDISYNLANDDKFLDQFIGWELYIYGQYIGKILPRQGESGYYYNQIEGEEVTCIRLSTNTDSIFLSFNENDRLAIKNAKSYVIINNTRYKILDNYYSDVDPALLIERKTIDEFIPFKCRVI